MIHLEKTNDGVKWSWKIWWYTYTNPESITMRVMVDMNMIFVWKIIANAASMMVRTMVYMNVVF